MLLNDATLTKRCQIIGIAAASALALGVTAPAWSQTLPQTLPQAAIEVQAPIQRVEEGRVFLTQGWQDGLAVGMRLDLRDTQNAVVGRVLLTTVGPRASEGVVETGGLSATNPATAVSAVAPFPLTVTSVQGHTLSFLLPRGNRALRVGDVLAVVRNGVVIGTASFNGYRPVAATLQSLEANGAVRVGDVLLAYRPEQTFPVVAPIAPPLVPAPLFPIPSAPSSTTPISAPPATVPSTTPLPEANSGGNAGAIVQAPRNPMDSRDIFAVRQGETVGASIGRVAERPAKRRADAGSSLSRSGASGLIKIPTARVTPDGRVRIAAFGKRRGVDIAQFGNSSRYAASIGFLPGLEIGATVGATFQNRDITANAKLQLLHERKGLPAIAVGVAEAKKLAGRGLKPTYYVAASKTVLKGAAAVSGGVLHAGNGRGTRAFGGLEVGLTRHISAVVEHDTQRVNYGARASVLRDHVQVEAQHVDRGWTYQLGLSVPLNIRSKPTADVVLPNLGANLDAEAAAHAIQARLVELGLESVRVRSVQDTITQTGVVQTGVAQNGSELGTVQSAPMGTGLSMTQSAVASGAGLVVSYENRSFAHSELDALANVLATIAAYAPPGTQRIGAIIRRADIPVLRVSCSLQAYRQFLAGQLDEASFATGVVIDQETSEVFPGSGAVVVDTGSSKSPHGRGDVFLRPGLRTEVGSDAFTVGVGISLQPELDLPLLQGLRLNARLDLPLAGPLQLRRHDTTLDRLALNYSFKAGNSLVGRAYLGRFPARRDGALIEGIYRPDGSRFQARAAAGVVSRSEDTGSDNSGILLGEGRYYLPRLDLSTRLTAGRFVEGDNGYTVGLLRRFGDTEVGVQVRDTNLGRAGVVTLGIPLGPGYVGNPPSTLRLRPPDFLDYNQRSLLTEPNFIGIANLTGNELPVGSDATRGLLDRDRLQRPYLLRSLSLLKSVQPFAASAPSSFAAGSQLSLP